MKKARHNKNYMLMVGIALFLLVMQFNPEHSNIEQKEQQLLITETEFESIENDEVLKITQEDIQTAALTVPKKLEKQDNVNQNGLREKVTKNQQQKIRGAYYSTSYVNSNDKINKLIHTLKNMKLNAVVIDIKSDNGYLTFSSNNKLAQKIGAIRADIQNLQEMTDLFHENDIYVIGRLVAFRDEKLAQAMPTMAVQTKNGKVFKDHAGDAWLNPYSKEVWEYLIQIAEEAISYGVDEIQFDYLRFSTEAKEGKVILRGQESGLNKTQIITAFVRTAVTRIHDQNAYVSADVFGAIIQSEVDAKTVGQDYVELSRYLDTICPMIYPSHYANGCYGLEVPDLQPYELVFRVLLDSMNELAQIRVEEHQANVRPWLQDFTASWKSVYQKYGSKEVNEQIQAVYDSGYQQWLLWNSSGRYSKGT